MKLSFSIEQSSLSPVLSLIQGVCSRKTALDTTANVLFSVNSDSQEVVIQATDLELSFQFTLPARISDTEYPRFTVNAKRLYDFVNDLEGEIFFSFDGSMLTINYAQTLGQTPDNSSFSLNLLTSPAEAFPVFPEKIEVVTNLNASFFKKALEKITIASNIMSSNLISGLLFEFGPEGLGLVLTNGHALAKVHSNKITLSETASWVLPKKAVAELKRIMEFCAKNATSSTEIFLGTCKGQLVFSGPGFNFFARLLAEPFPNYRPAMSNQDFFKGRVSLTSLHPVLKRVGYLLGGKFLPAQFNFKSDKSNGLLEINFYNSDSGQLHETLSFEALSKFSIVSKFYSPYILAACHAFEEMIVDFYIKSSAHPVFFEHYFDDSELSLTYLVMPISS